MSERFVYFDLGKVLVHFEHRIAVEQLARESGRPRALIDQFIFTDDLQIRYETGLVNDQQFAAEVNLALESALPQAVILKAISDIFEPNLPIMAAIELVQSAGVPIGILSNTCPAHWNWILSRDWPMLRVDWQTIVLSYEVHSMKPAPQIYEVCEQRAGCSGANVFFTDDRADNIAAAAARGWTTHQFLDVDRLLADLNSWL